jgi:hypothetical protein
LGVVLTESELDLIVRLVTDRRKEDMEKMICDAYNTR